MTELRLEARAQPLASVADEDARASMVNRVVNRVDKTLTISTEKVWQ